LTTSSPPSKRSKTTAKPDNSRFIVAAAKRRHDDAVQRAIAALHHLDQSGQPINFTTVAHAASVSRKWLYRVPELRDTIMSLRVTPPRPHPAVPSRQRATAESLRQRLDAALAELNQLRRDNQQLRDQLARHYGQHRARNAYQPPR
jgi:hypothetical protein